jgi:hypothetical protein
MSLILNKSILKDKAVIFLVFSNLITILIAYIEQWNFMALLWIYWFQSVIIGVINYIEMSNLKNFTVGQFSINGVKAKADEKTKNEVAKFFCMHYGIFHAVYLFFLVIFTVISSTEQTDGFIESLTTADVIGISIGCLIFLGNHIYGFITNKDRMVDKPNIGTMMFLPYARIVPMHIILILALLLNYAETLILFLVLKTFADVTMQIIETRKLRKPELATT